MNTTKQKCASNPQLDCTCGTSWVCNNHRIEEYHKQWPLYRGLELKMLLKLTLITKVQSKKEDCAEEIKYLQFLIENNNE